MSPSPQKPTVEQSDVEAVLGALRNLSDKAERAMSAGLLVECQVAIAALVEAAEFDGVGQ